MIKSIHVTRVAAAPQCCYNRSFADGRRRGEFVDQAWHCEEDFWQAGVEGRTLDYYSRVLAADAFVVVPERVLTRDDLLHEWQGRAAWADYVLSERRDVLINGETAVLSYRVQARQVDGNLYRARVSSVYTWVSGWTLAFRQHTPDIGIELGLSSQRSANSKEPLP